MRETEKQLDELVEFLKSGPRIAVLTGAGISAESGIPTFRGKDGLWNEFRAEELATPQAFFRDPKLVWEWYDWRRGIIGSKEPHDGHRVLARWERHFPYFVLITQNVDGFHRRAGSQNVLELHGNIWEVRCTREGTISENTESPLRKIPPLCPACGAMLRPNVCSSDLGRQDHRSEPGADASQFKRRLRLFGQSGRTAPAHRPTAVRRMTKRLKGKA